MAEQSPGSRERLTSCRALLQGHTGALWRGGGLCSGTSDVSSKSLYLHPALWRSPGGEGDCVFPCLRARLFTGSWQPFGKEGAAPGIRGHRGAPAPASGDIGAGRTALGPLAAFGFGEPRAARRRVASDAVPGL